MSNRTDFTITTARHVEAWRIRIALENGLQVKCSPHGTPEELAVLAAKTRKPRGRGVTQVLTNRGWIVPWEVWTIEQTNSQVERTSERSFEARSCRPGSCRKVSAATVGPDVAASLEPSLAAAFVFFSIVALLIFSSVAVAQISDKPTKSRESERGLSVQGSEVSDKSISQVLSAGATTQLPRHLGFELMKQGQSLSHIEQSRRDADTPFANTRAVRLSEVRSIYLLWPGEGVGLVSAGTPAVQFGKRSRLELDSVPVLVEGLFCGSLAWSRIWRDFSAAHPRQGPALAPSQNSKEGGLT